MFLSIKLTLFLLFNGCEIWTLMSKEETRLMVIEIRVVRRIFEVSGR
jgi:hypothetical protein